MPVSTRSQISNQEQDGGESHTSEHKLIPLSFMMRNPHHGLKEKMQALTLLYEQQKRSSISLKNDEHMEKKQDHSSSDLALKEANTVMVKQFSLPPHHARGKENLAAKPPASSTSIRKLSLPSLTEPRGIRPKYGQETELSPVKDNPGTRILVFVRLRPMAKKEKEAGSRCCVRIVNRQEIYLTEFAHENDYLRLKRLRGRHFTFDASFPDSATQEEVYSSTTSELVEAVLQGRNGSVFCYGATGAGKTYTMLGTFENPGVMVIAMKDLFQKVRERSYDGNHSVHLSYLEVYNETVRDLLSPGRPLILREDKQGMVAAGLTQYRAYSTDEVMALLQQGNQNRTTEPTRANETSSRSHAILQVVVEYKTKESSIKAGKLSLIDLAGSERALATDARTLRSVEGANINRSLLALSSCINALVEGKKHIPYRNSKLTQLLKDSLGGACNTVMIANISPSSLSFAETQNTLHWADRAKEIRTKACNQQELETETNPSKLILELQRENRELRVQLAKQQQKLLAVRAQAIASPATCHLTPSHIDNNLITPESKKRKADETRDLMQMVRALDAEMKRMKKEHAVQIKQKDDIIREISRKLKLSNNTNPRTLTRASVRPKAAATNTRTGGELKTPAHRFTSPAPTAKKRSFWDITSANSPSVTTTNARKTRSSVAREYAQRPSLLPKPGFARHK